MIAIGPLAVAVAVVVSDVVEAGFDLGKKCGFGDADDLHNPSIHYTVGTLDHFQTNRLSAQVYNSKTIPCKPLDSPVLKVTGLVKRRNGRSVDAAMTAVKTKVKYCGGEGAFLVLWVCFREGAVFVLAVALIPVARSRVLVAVRLHTS